MNVFRVFGVCVFLTLPCVTLAEVTRAPSETRMQQWPQWRGPLANGIAPQATPPVEWSQQKNIRWKIPIPGEGNATPIIWQDQIFLVTAIPTERVAEKPPVADPDARTEPPRNFYEFTVLCLDRTTGKTLWKQIAIEAVPHEGRHITNSYASGSPCTDGQRLYVSFGSRGFYAYSLDGQLLWSRDLGKMRTRRGWGESVTPALHAETLIVNWDQEDDSKLIALDARTGETRWQVPRDEPTTWTTPLIVPYRDRNQVIINGTNRVRSYDLATGQVIWECGGQTVNPIPTPVIADDVVYATSGYQGAAAMAIPLDSKGDITDTTNVLWSHRDSTPYVPSPLVYNGQLYFTRTNTGILTSLRAKDGAVVYGPHRLPGIDNVYASPIVAEDRLYIVSREGTTIVLRTGQSPEVLATNSLDDPIDASPVAVGRQLFLRSHGHLYCIESQ